MNRNPLRALALLATLGTSNDMTTLTTTESCDLDHIAPGTRPIHFSRTVVCTQSCTADRRCLGCEDLAWCASVALARQDCHEYAFCCGMGDVTKR